jgi:Zinc knuckle
MNNDELEENNIEISEITGQFSGGFKKNNGFGGTIKMNTSCFNCGKTGHWARDCNEQKNIPRGRTNNPNRNTKQMNRSNSRNRKGQERIANQNRRNNRSPSPSYRKNRSSSPRERAITRSRRNRKWKPRFVTVNNILYEEQKDGILIPYENDDYNQYNSNYEIQNINQEQVFDDQYENDDQYDSDQSDNQYDNAIIYNNYHNNDQSDDQYDSDQSDDQYESNHHNN